jgi:hypothetical protein
MRPVLPIMVATALLLAGGARAQEAIPTAANTADGGAPAAAPTGGPIIISNRREHDDRGPVRVGPCGGVERSVDGGPPKPDRNPHGEVWAGAGTHGYRDVGGVVCIPAGDNAAVTIAVDANHWGRR